MDYRQKSPFLFVVVFLLCLLAVLSPVESRALPRLKRQTSFYIANETVCVVDGVVYHNGDPIPNAEPCESCNCRPPGFACVLQKCVEKEGCRALEKEKDECCPKYVCDNETVESSEKTTVSVTALGDLVSEGTTIAQQTEAPEQSPSSTTEKELEGRTAEEDAATTGVGDDAPSTAAAEEEAITTEPTVGGQLQTTTEKQDPPPEPQDTEKQQHDHQSDEQHDHQSDEQHDHKSHEQHDHQSNQQQDLQADQQYDEKSDQQYEQKIDQKSEQQVDLQSDQQVTDKSETPIASPTPEKEEEPQSTTEGDSEPISPKVVSTTTEKAEVTKLQEITVPPTEAAPPSTEKAEEPPKVTTLGGEEEVSLEERSHHTSTKPSEDGESDKLTFVGQRSTPPSQDPDEEQSSPGKASTPENEPISSTKQDSESTLSAETPSPSSTEKQPSGRQVDSGATLKPTTQSDESIPSEQTEQVVQQTTLEPERITKSTLPPNEGRDSHDAQSSTKEPSIDQSTQVAELSSPSKIEQEVTTLKSRATTLPPVTAQKLDNPTSTVSTTGDADLTERSDIIQSTKEAQEATTEAQVHDPTQQPTGQSGDPAENTTPKPVGDKSSDGPQGRSEDKETTVDSLPTIPPSSPSTTKSPDSEPSPTVQSVQSETQQSEIPTQTLEPSSPKDEKQDSATTISPSTES